MKTTKKPPTTSASTSEAAKHHRALRKGYRSGLEETVAFALAAQGIHVNYEPPEAKISFVQPAVHRKYTPDFRLPNGILIETKGYFTLEDRKKHLLIKAQMPHIDIRFVFTRASQPIRKGSKKTYAGWCIEHGFLFAERFIPQAWIQEKPRYTI